jgi:hypothetical protein
VQDGLEDDGSNVRLSQQLPQVNLLLVAVPVAEGAMAHRVDRPN